MALQRPDPAMLEPAAKIVHFMETRDPLVLADAFADDATILDSFAPYIFQGKNAVADWAGGFIRDAQDLENLSHGFGEPREFSSSPDKAFFSLPVTWRGKSNGVSFFEIGGLALMLVSRNGKWYIQHYGWAVVDYSAG